MVGKEAQTFKKRIAHLLAEKWGMSYSKLHVFVRSKMALPVV